MTFYKWIRKFKKEETPIGDLARDIYDDFTFPKKSRSKERLLEYLKSEDKERNMFKGAACQDAIDAFNKAWAMYEEQQVTS